MIRYWFFQPYGDFMDRVAPDKRLAKSMEFSRFAVLCFGLTLASRRPAMVGNNKLNGPACNGRNIFGRMMKSKVVRLLSQIPQQRLFKTKLRIKHECPFAGPP